MGIRCVWYWMGRQATDESARTKSECAATSTGSLLRSGARYEGASIAFVHQWCQSAKARDVCLSRSLAA